MTLTIDRFATGDEGTQGRAELNGAAWVSLELPWRDNAPDISCIPAGSYRAALLMSLEFARPLYHILNVPNRTGIMLHPLNWAGDVAKGFKSDSKGCLGLGHQFGHLTVAGATGQLALLASTFALSEFMAVAQGQDLDVEVKWVEGVSPE